MFEVCFSTKTTGTVNSLYVTKENMLGSIVSRVFFVSFFAAILYAVVVWQQCN